jgi:hypothetical protein
MNRRLATALLAMMVIGLLFSVYSLFQGRFAEALLIYPLLIAIWVFFRMGDRGKK